MLPYPASTAAVQLLSPCTTAASDAARLNDSEKELDALTSHSLTARHQENQMTELHLSILLHLLRLISKSQQEQALQHVCCPQMSFIEEACGVQAFELRMWPHQHPLRQFEGILAQELLFKMEDRGLWMERLQVSPIPSPVLPLNFL